MRYPLSGDFRVTERTRLQEHEMPPERRLSGVGAKGALMYEEPRRRAAPKNFFVTNQEYDV